MNVIYIMGDQQRADSYGPGRHPCANFPNLEKLAAESVSFSRCYAAAIPCVPSRMVALSGQNEWRAGVFL
jgi:arylsulfatase